MSIQSIFRKSLNFNTIVCVRLTPFYNKLWFWTNKVIYGRNMCVMGKVYLNITGKMTIGDNFMMTSGCAINPISSNQKAAFYVEPNATVNIGNYVGMSSTRMWIAKGLTIGNNVNIGAGVLIMDTDCHQVDNRMRRHDASLHFSQTELSNAVVSAPVVIEDDVWIGANVTILKGVTVGARSVIGAGSIVTKSIPADCVAAGNPAQVVKYLNQ